MGQKAGKPKKTRSYRRSGTLMTIAVLLMGSAIVRIGLDAGPAIAREVASLSEPGAETKPDPGKAMQKNAAGPSSAELQTMLAAFQKREQALAAREAEFQDRMKALEIADQAIDKKLVALQQAEEKLRTTLAMADGATEADVTRLTTVYEQMKPKEAAALFEEMDPGFAAGFLARMQPEAAAGIMAGLSPEAAYTISVVLAGRNGNVPKE